MEELMWHNGMIRMRAVLWGLASLYSLCRPYTHGISSLLKPLSLVLAAPFVLFVLQHIGWFSQTRFHLPGPCEGTLIFRLPDLFPSVCSFYIFPSLFLSFIFLFFSPFYSWGVIYLTKLKSNKKSRRHPTMPKQLANPYMHKCMWTLDTDTPSPLLQAKPPLRHFTCNRLRLRLRLYDKAYCRWNAAEGYWTRGED